MTKVAVEVVKGHLSEDPSQPHLPGHRSRRQQGRQGGNSLRPVWRFPREERHPRKAVRGGADTSEELEENLAMYEADNVDVTVVVDDTLCKGVESWGWYGLQPINQLTKENGTLLVTSMQGRGDLIQDTHLNDVPYQIGVVKGSVSFSGLWVYKDDHTDVRILGALCKVCPDMVSMETMEEAIKEQWGTT